VRAESKQHRPAAPIGALARRPLVTDDDASLVARANVGESWAEDAIYRRHAPLVTRICSRMLGRPADADDAVQDTFVVAFAKLKSLRDPALLRPWLVRIAIQKAQRMLRKRRLLQWCGIDQTAEQPGINLRSHEHTRPDLRLEIEALERTLARQPSEQRVAWLLHRVEELTIQETAEATAKSTATVKRYVAAVDAHVERAHGGRDD
jgi:RNA polymerase sigma-70 factor (ECF subfamily)